MTNIISLKEHSKKIPKLSTELQRSVLEAVYAATKSTRPEGLSVEDTFLAQLWADGFKVVPLPVDGDLSIGGMDVVVDPSVPEGMILVKDQRAKEIVVAMIFKGPQPNTNDGEGQ